jgi:hypothetical protein
MTGVENMGGEKIGGVKTGKVPTGGTVSAGDTGPTGESVSIGITLARAFFAFPVDFLAGAVFFDWRDASAAFVVGFVTIYFSAVEFGPAWGARYTAFAQNLMMSLLFIGMLVSRHNVSGQSLYVAILKWVGTAAPTIQIYAQTGSKLILILGIGCFFYDALYTGMLYRQFRELGLNPFTRKPLADPRMPPKSASR